jgi:hypothetical protein
MHSLGLIENGFLLRLGIDLICTVALIRGVYYRSYGRTDLFLTLFSFNLVIFLLAFLLNRVEMTLGTAFGLFAVFSMLRYRTEGLSASDMTYLFLVIALGLILSIGGGEWPALAAIAGAIVVVTWVLEGNGFVRRERRQSVLYDKIELVHAGAREALLADLRERTGLPIHRVDVEEIDLLKDSAKLIVYYHDPPAATIAAAALLLLATGAAPATAQTSRSNPDDIQSRYGLQLGLDLPNRWEASAGYELRLVDNSSSYRGSYVYLDAQHEPVKDLALMAGYRLASVTTGTFHRYSAGAESEVKTGKITTLALRGLLQHQRQSFSDDEQRTDEDTFVRARLKASFDVSERVELYASVEPYFILGGDETIDNVRNTAGVELAFAKIGQVDLYYVYRPDYAKRYNRTFHILGIALEMEIKVPKQRQGKPGS